jgi:hypothetical protein
MARPRKIKTPPADLRADLSTPETVGLFAQMAIDTARVDPFNEEPLACIFGPVLLGRATAAEKKFVGELCAEVLATAPEKAPAFFARVAKMAANIEQPHRNAYALYGYARFIAETGKEPSKRELREYLLENPKVFPGMPAGDGSDKKGWDRLWKDSGLSNLPPA